MKSLLVRVGYDQLMAYRSWLKDVKRIHDLGEHLHNIAYRTEKECERADKKDRKWQEMRNRPLPVADAYKQIYGGWMHDSPILALRYEGKRLEIDLNCDFTYVCVNWLCDWLGIEGPEIDYPITLVFEEVAYATSVRVDPEGYLKWSEWQEPRPGKFGEVGDTFISDWFYTQENRLQWICETWSPGRPGKLLGRDLYILVDCAEATAIDRRCEKIGSAISPLAALVCEGFLKGKGLDLFVDFEKSIEVVLADYGATLDDLRASIL